MRKRRGFTLIELIVVMAIVATILMMVTLRLDGMTPKYALRAAAREVGATIDLARGTSAGRGVMTGIEYNVDQGVYTLYGPAHDGTPGLFPVGAPRTLPAGVRFRGVYAHAKGQSAQGSGVLQVRFDPLSLGGSHIVYLESTVTGKQISVKYNALLGSCDYVDGTAEFEAPPQ
jgi:prepilin-type N-terminal cleavage/methylation domain-containing protein